MDLKDYLQIRKMQTITYEKQNELLKFFQYGNTEEDLQLRVYGSPESPLFCAKDVANILGYMNTRQAVLNNVDPEDRLSLGESRVFCKDSSKVHPHLTLINESGLYSLVLRSKKQEAKKFQRWITSEVIPSIRKTGSYQVQPVNQIDRTTPEYWIGLMHSMTELFRVVDESKSYDDRTVLLIKDLTRNKILGNNQSLDVNNPNQEFSVSRRLSETFGVNNLQAHKKLSSFGKKMKAKYVELYDDLPPTRVELVNGTSRSVNHYTRQDFEDFGDNLMRDYFREYIKNDCEELDDSSIYVLDE